MLLHRIATKKRLVELYLSNNDYASCTSALNGLMSAAGDKNREDAIAYSELTSLLVSLAQENRSIAGMSESQLQTLRNIASGNTPTATKAKGILKAATGEDFAYPIQKFGPGTRNIHIGKNSQSLSGNNFSLYPNPTSNEIFFEYNANEYKEGIIEIYDKLGRKVKETNFTGEENKVVLNTSGLENGVYQFVVKCNHEIIFQDQMIIIK